MRRTTALVLFLLGVLVTACGGTDTSAPQPPSGIGSIDSSTTTAAAAPDIVISNYTFTVRGPVKAGQPVTIVNNDESSHSVTADAGNVFDVRVSGGGGTSTFTAPTTPGTYALHCKYHAHMVGSLTVQ